ncbi:FAD/NAD(P)-binding domain-containing protein [Myriangium duriaei CBS 260.36]|uniref:FAD/NAD(P)-binding domain-containing protein n=1 Tax=Myriangium duriaei CBS 260.36 TaxID=1168546 RepID=A0A9P4IU12_9PEZI|nr:FAD/NAD(P)-binding domain-containing protein [Myriangium duriaei CBS 260.36]
MWPVEGYTTVRNWRKLPGPRYGVRGLSSINLGSRSMFLGTPHNLMKLLAAAQFFPALVPTMTGDTPKIRIALVGGGIGGLCLAAGLASQPHLDIHIYESVPRYTDIGAGLALHRNAILGMDLISPSIKKAYFSRALNMAEEAEEEIVTDVLLASGPNMGATVAQLGRAKGRKTVARADLLAGLLELMPAEQISFGKRLSSIRERTDDTVELSFEDGTTVEADCLIGCDGIHSATRSYLLGEDHPATKPQNHDGWQIYRTLIPFSEAKKYVDERWLRSVSIQCGPRGHINCMPLHLGRDISAGVAVRGAITSTTSGTPPLTVENFSNYSKDAQDIVRMIAKDTSASWTIHDHDHAPTYFRRRVCMMGDAAHAALPFAGNGAAQAIEDAAVLHALFATLTAPEQIPAAFEAYDTIRRPRSQKVVEIARDFGRLYGFALDGYGDDPEKMRGYFKEKAAFTNEADIKGQNDEALRKFAELVESGARWARKDSMAAEKGGVAVGVAEVETGRGETRIAA